MDKQRCNSATVTALGYQMRPADARRQTGHALSAGSAATLNTASIHS